jgi:hypothetical protein
VLYAPPGIFAGLGALDKFAGDFRPTHPRFVYAPHGEAQALTMPGVSLGGGAARRAAELHWLGCDHRPRGKIAALDVFLDPVQS